MTAAAAIASPKPGPIKTAAAQAAEEPITLSAQLSASSRAVHNRSNSILHARLIVLFTNRTLYGQALACFLTVFHALEEQLRLHKEDNTDVAAVWTSLEPLFRTKGFELDMEFFLGPQWPQQVPHSAPAVAKYVAHLKVLGSSDPTLLLAHAYTQHLALASGGQVIKRMARKRLKLPEDQGTGAFEYPGRKASPTALKNAFMEQFNTLGQGMTPERRAQLVAEHQAAFRHNNAIISEFRVGWWNFLRGLVRLVPPLTRLSLAVLLATGVAAYAWPKPA